LVKVREGPPEAADLPEAAISAGSQPDPGRNKILYVVGSLDVGGTERHLALLVPRLKRMGWEPVIYCLSRPGEQATEVQQAGVQVISAPFPIVSGQGWIATRALKLGFSTLKLLWLMLSARPQIAHFFLPVAYLLGAPLALLARIPIRIMSRRSLNDYQAAHPLFRTCELRLHKHMTAILGNARSIVSELIEDEHCPADRVALIYNGIDTSAFAKRREPHEGLVLITVANLIAYKGHAHLLAALGQIASALPPRWSLLCVGRDDGIGAALTQQTRDLGIGDKVMLLGVRRDIPALLAGADIGILVPHQNEGFSNSILEGMAASLPMVVTDVGGNAEAVLDGITGLVVPARDADTLGSAISKLVQDSRLRQSIGEAGCKRVERYFTIDRCVANYARLYAGLLQGKLPADIAGLDTAPPR
jgi:glycosyltransferase involved in cell wall biosynthesis